MAEEPDPYTLPPEVEAQRLRSLERLHIFHSPPEDRFAHITRMAQVAMGVPMSAINFIDRDTQWCKQYSADHQLDFDVPRDQSVCRATIARAYQAPEDLALVYRDLTDSEFADLPAIAQEDGVRFYAGFPLFGPGGHPVGTFCVYDTEPRQMSAQERQTFEELAAWAQRELQSSDYQRALEIAAVGMCLTEPEGRLVEVNDALCKYFGYNADTLMQKTWQDITAPDFLQADLDRVEEMVAGHLDSYRTVKQFVHADGHLIWGDLSVACIRDDRGQVWRFVAQIVDVTDEVRAREELDEARSLLAASADSMLDPQMLLEGIRDPAGRVVDFRYLEANAAACKDMAMSRDELIGKTVLELLPGFAESGPLSFYVRCLETGEPGALDDYSYDHEIQASSRRYDIRVAPAGNDLISLTFRDVTDRFQAAQSALAAQTLLHATVDSMLNPQTLLEAVRDPAGRVIDFVYRSANRAFCSYRGSEEHDIIGTSLVKAQPDLVDTGLFERYVHSVDTGEPVVLDDFGLFDTILDGHRRFDIRVVRAGVDLLSLTFGDVTERYRAAERIAVSEEKYRLLAMNSTDAVVHVRDGRVAWVSPSIEGLLGAPAEHWLGSDLTKSIPPEDLPAFDRRWARLAAGETVQERSRVTAIDGIIHWVHVHAAPFFDLAGRRDGTTVSLRLIDDEIQQEEENRRLADLLDAEMASAKDYVASILPDDLHGAVEITSRYMPAMDLGGDGFHYRWLDDDHLQIYLIDVSGHGIRPALLSVSVNNVIRSGSLPMSTQLHPDRLLDKLNRDFQMEDQGDTYFTIWYGVYQLSTRTLRYSSAGHPPTLALNRDVDTITATALSTPGTPIGVFDDATYTTDSYSVPPDAQLLLYSDGAYEFTGHPTLGQPLSHRGFADLCATLAAQPDWSLDLLINRLKDASPDGDFDDDCALVLATFPSPTPVPGSVTG